MLLLAAAVALPCAVLYRAVVSNATPPVQVVLDRWPSREWDPPRAPVIVPEAEEDRDLDPISADDLVCFSPPSSLMFQFLNYSTTPSAL